MVTVGISTMFVFMPVRTAGTGELGPIGEES